MLVAAAEALQADIDKLTKYAAKRSNYRTFIDDNDLIADEGKNVRIVGIVVFYSGMMIWLALWIIADGKRLVTFSLDSPATLATPYNFRW